MARVAEFDAAIDQVGEQHAIGPVQANLIGGAERRTRRSLRTRPRGECQEEQNCGPDANHDHAPRIDFNFT